MAWAYENSSGVLNNFAITLALNAPEPIVGGGAYWQTYFTDANWRADQLYLTSDWNWGDYESYVYWNDDITFVVDTYVYDPDYFGNSDWNFVAAGTYTFEWFVVDVNEAPTAVTLTNTTSSIQENISTASHIKVADIAVTDDALGTNTLGLTGADASSFEIVGSSLYLKVGATLDYETKSSYSVAVTADDSTVGGTPDATSATYTLAVSDVNEAQTSPLGGNSAVSRPAIDDATGIIFFDRNAPITESGQISAWSIYAGRTGGQVELLIYRDVGTTWTLVGNSQLETVGSLGVNSYSLSSPISVLAGDIIAFWYPPNTIPSVVGTFDQGITINNHDWPSEPIGASRLSSTYLGTIPELHGGIVFDDTVWDANTRTYSINVSGVSWAPDITSNGGGDQATIAWLENATGTVTQVSYTDPHVGGPVTFALTGTDAGLFNLDTSTGVLTFKSTPNFEAPADANHDNAYSVTVEIHESGDVDSQALTIQVQNVNEAPNAALTNTMPSIQENTSTASWIKVADIAVTDDALGTNTLGLTGADAAFFEIDGSALFLKAGTLLDFESKTGYSVAVTVDDASIGGTPDATSATYTLAVTNVREGPEIALTGNGLNIADDDLTPATADGTAFGTVGAGSMVTHTFNVTNLGDEALSISKFKMAKGFVLTEGLAASIAPGATDTFTVRLDTAKVGVKTGVVSFTTNDTSEAAYNFALSGDVVVIPSEIEVLGNGIVIADNDTTPAVADDTDFGSATLGDIVIHTFTVNNTGDGVLNISKLKMPKGFVLVEGLSSSIAAHSSDTFQVRLDTAKAGVKTGTLSFTTNDPDETAFNFNFSGTVTTASAAARQTDWSSADPFASLPADAFVFADVAGQPATGLDGHDPWHAHLNHYDLA